MKLTMTIDGKNIETDIGDGLIRMSYMTPEGLAAHLVNEVFQRTWKLPAIELMAKRITEIRQTSEKPE